MTDYQLLNQIDELVASKTFNLDALDGIKAIKDNLKITLGELDAANEKLELRRTENRELMTQVAEKDARISRLEKQIAEMRDAANDGKVARYEAEMHKAVAGAWREAMQTVFKPNAVRETVQRQVARPVEGHPGGNGSYPTAGYLATGQESETVTREDA